MMAVALAISGWRGAGGEFPGATPENLPLAALRRDDRDRPLVPGPPGRR
jgi:hypothetical protein